ncbi:hypothetical protein A6A07_22940 [Streptomyces sp. CB03911]|nr:hypothetical protein A6A07_22940 [Streptomyces sp. CB03911]
MPCRRFSGRALLVLTATSADGFCTWQWSSGHLENVLADALEQIEEMRERISAVEAGAKTKKSITRKPG